MAAIGQLSALYYKEGNSQAGMTYRKACAALRELAFEVTSGKTISRGKGKVAGIGEKTGEIIDEFLQTGAIARLGGKKEVEAVEVQDITDLVDSEDDN